MIKSGDLKAVPNPLEKSNEYQISYVKDIVIIMQKEFSKIVKLEREISAENFLKINDGRIFTGSQAKEINLIDENLACIIHIILFILNYKNTIFRIIYFNTI